MKRFGLLMLAAVCCLALVTSCKDNDGNGETPCPPDSDTSLAGSVTMGGYNISEAEYSHGETVFEGMAINWSIMDIQRVSPSVVTFYCNTAWKNATLKINIPNIPITGQRYDVTFDHSTDDAEVTIDKDNKYASVSASIKGWIKRPDMLTRCTIARPEYTCEIDIECTVNELPLKFKITAIVPYLVAD